MRDNSDRRVDNSDRSDNRRIDKSDNRVDRSGDRRVDKSGRSDRSTRIKTEATPPAANSPPADAESDNNVEVVAIQTAADREAAARTAAVDVDDPPDTKSKVKTEKSSTSQRNPAQTSQHRSVPILPSRIEVVLKHEERKPGVLGHGTRYSPYDLTLDPTTFARVSEGRRLQQQAITAKKSDDGRRREDEYAYKSNAREQRKGSLAKFRWHRSVGKQKRRDSKTPGRRAKSRTAQSKELREGPTRPQQVQPTPIGQRRRVIQYSY